MKLLFDRPGLLLTLTALFWAGNTVIGRGVAGLVPPVTFAFLRWTLATLIFLPFALPYLRRDFAVLRKSWRTILFLGLLGPGSYNTLSYLALTSTEAMNTFVLGASGPMFITLLAWALFGEPVGLRQLLGLAAAFFGVLIIIAKGDLSSLATLQFNNGDLFMIAAMIFWSVYTVFLRKRPALSWQSFNLATYAVAAAANLPLALIENGTGDGMTVNAATVGAVAYVAVFPSLIAYIFYNRGVELLGPSRSGLYSFLVPVFGAGLAAFFLGEALQLYHAAGFVFVIGGVLLGTRR